MAADDSTPAPAPPAPEAAAGLERRLHPLSFLFELLTHVRGLLLPALFVLVTARWTNLDLLFAPIAVAILAQALIRQFSTTYEIRESELVVRRSLIVHRNERHIRFSRVHNLVTSATPIHRWLGVVEVAVETASGAEPEATLRVLSTEAFDELRARVASSSAAVDAARSTTTDAGDRGVLVELSTRDLVVFGLLNSRGLVIAGALAGLAWEAVAALQGGVPWDPRSWTAPWSVFRTQGGALLSTAWSQSFLVLIAIVLGLLAVLKLLSIVWALVSLHGFRAARTATGITVEHGIFPRTSTSIPFARIQRVVVRERLLPRLLGHVEVQLDTVGGGAGGEQHREPVWLAPILTRSRRDHLLREIGVGVAPDDAAWEPLHPRAARRLRTQWLIIFVILSVMLGSTIGWRVGLGALAVLLPFALLLGGRQARAMAYATDAWHVLVRRGWLRRALLITWVDRVQCVAVTASPFDRRHGMSSVVVDTAAGSTIETRMEIPFLDAAVARGVARRVAAQAAATRFQW